MPLSQLSPDPPSPFRLGFPGGLNRGNSPLPLSTPFHALLVYTLILRRKRKWEEKIPPPSTVRMVVCRGGNVTAILVSVGFMSYRFDLFNSYWFEPWRVVGCINCQHPLKFKIWIAKHIHFYPLKIFLHPPGELLI